MQRVGVQCSGSRFPSSLRECPPLTGAPSAFVDKGSIRKRTVLQSLIQSMQQNNVVEVVRDTTSPGCYCHLFLVPKKSGGWRPVIDLSFLNSFLEIPHFTMESAESIQRSLPRGTWVTSIDLVDAFFHIPIHRGYRKCLRFQTRDTIYQFRVLPFGLSPAPWVFTKIMTEIKMQVHVMGINLCQCLDDWLIYSPSHDQCLRDTVQVLNLCHTMGLLSHDKNSELIPKQKFLFLGYHSNSGSISQNQSTNPLIPAKPRRMCSCVADPARSLCGHRKIGSSGMATHQRSPTLHLSMLGFRCFNQQFVDTSFPPAGEDLQWWKSAHNVLRGAPITPTEPNTQLFIAASNIGWGAHWNALTVSGLWTTTEKTLHINVLELEAIYRAMLHWLRKRMGLTVLVASDNSIMSYINKQGGTRSIQLCRRTKKLLLMCQANQIVLRAQHIPGRLNVLADILSHPSQMSGTEWSLHTSVFRELTREWGIHYWICLQ